MFHSLVLASIVLFGGPPAQQGEPMYEFKLNKADNTIVAVKENDRTVFVVTCPVGIGYGSIKLKGGQWPENVTFRLQHGKDKGFTNLEDFKLTTDRLQLEGSLKMSGKFSFCFLNAKGTPVGVGTPVGARPSAGELAVRVESRNGALEVTLPSCLLIGSSQVRLDWVNEFRN